MNEAGNETCRLTDHLADKHLVTLGHYRSGGSAEMLGHRYGNLCRGSQRVNSGSLGYLVVVGMNSTNLERYHTVTSFFSGKLNLWMAPVGHSLTHLVQSLQTLKSM